MVWRSPFQPSLTSSLKSLSSSSDFSLTSSSSSFFRLCSRPRNHRRHRSRFRYLRRPLICCRRPHPRNHCRLRSRFCYLRRSPFCCRRPHPRNHCRLRPRFRYLRRSPICCRCRHPRNHCRLRLRFCYLRRPRPFCMSSSLLSFWSSCRDVLGVFTGTPQPLDTCPRERFCPNTLFRVNF